MRRFVVLGCFLVVAALQAGDDPRAQALQNLRAALLDPGEVNHVSEYLRGLVAS